MLGNEIDIVGHGFLGWIGGPKTGPMDDRRPIIAGVDLPVGPVAAFRHQSAEHEKQRDAKRVRGSARRLLAISSKHGVAARRGGNARFGLGSGLMELSQSCRSAAENSASASLVEDPDEDARVLRGRTGELGHGGGLRA